MNPDTGKYERLEEIRELAEREQISEAAAAERLHGSVAAVAAALLGTAAAEDEQPAASPGAQIGQMQVPALQLDLSGVSVSVGKGQDGTRALLIGPLVLQFVLPLSPEAARGLGLELQGGLEIASVIDPRLIRR